MSWRRFRTVPETDHPLPSSIPAPQAQLPRFHLDSKPWLVRITRAVNAHHVVAQNVDIPDNERSGGKIICTFLRHLPLRSWSVIILTTNLNCKHRRAIEELHSRVRANIKRRVRTRIYDAADSLQNQRCLQLHIQFWFFFT